MVGIYKIENKLNHKCYIGQALDIELRFKQHKDGLISSAKSWYPEARSESKNINDFEFTILQECKPQELDELESYWIKQYNCYNNGYNKTRDGAYAAGKEIIDLSNAHILSTDELFYFMRQLNGNTFKFLLYLIEKSKTEQYIIKSPAIISNDTGLSVKNGTKDALSELIKRGFMEQNGEVYILKI